MGPTTDAAANSPPSAVERRYERKFLGGDLSEREVLLAVKRHPALFVEEYPARWVNNVYLDRIDLKGVRDNLDGLSERRKTRVRWYGELSGRIERPALEQKVKRGHVGWKETARAAPFELVEAFDGGSVKRACLHPGLADRLRHELAALRPTLLNRYHRRYFRSADGRYRVTIDGAVSYHALGPLRSRLRRWVEDRTGPVELKYAVEHDADAAAIASAFPFRVGKSSKYVTGILLVTSW